MVLFTFSRSQNESYELNAFDLCLIIYGYVCNTYLPRLAALFFLPGRQTFQSIHI